MTPIKEEYQQIVQLIKKMSKYKKLIFAALSFIPVMGIAIILPTLGYKLQCAVNDWYVSVGISEDSSLMISRLIIFMPTGVIEVVLLSSIFIIPFTIIEKTR